MHSPLQITFRHMAPSPTLESRIRRRAEELDQVFDRITGCRVVVECQHRHPHQGRLFDVHVDLSVPGAEIVVGRDPGLNHAHEDPRVAVRDAFDAARRRLEDRARVLRTAAKRGAPAREMAESEVG